MPVALPHPPPCQLGVVFFSATDFPPVLETLKSGDTPPPPPTPKWFPVLREEKGQYVKVSWSLPTYISLCGGWLGHRSLPLSVFPCSVAVVARAGWRRDPHRRAVDSEGRGRRAATIHPGE